MRTESDADKMSGVLNTLLLITTTATTITTTVTTTTNETIDPLKGETFSEDSLKRIRRMRLSAVRKFNNSKNPSVRARMANLINRLNGHLDLPPISVDDTYNTNYKTQE